MQCRKEFEFLVGHGNVEKLQMSHVNIFNETNNFLFLEEILEMLQKVQHFLYVYSFLYFKIYLFLAFLTQITVLLCLRLF